MKALDIVVLDKKIMGAPGTWLAGFVKRTTIHCYTHHMKALDIVVLDKKIFFCFSHCKAMEANDPRGGAIFDPGS